MTYVKPRGITLAEYESRKLRAVQVSRYRDSERIYRLIDRREASKLTGKANRRGRVS